MYSVYYCETDVRMLNCSNYSVNVQLATSLWFCRTEVYFSAIGEILTEMLNDSDTDHKAMCLRMRKQIKTFLLTSSSENTVVYCLIIQIPSISAN